jgi:S-adenosyl-L-methionine hydrolase (adenosine-forming)
MTVITLTTDFGLREGNVASMKGVIWRIAPQVDIADLSHLIAPQNILEGARMLGRTLGYFPPDTIHIGVVDPGVGTLRRPIAARLGDCYFVGPDNGLMTFLLEWAEERQQPVEVVHLDQPRFWLDEVTFVFHGRDIFSPVAAHIANGIPLCELGVPIPDALRLSTASPQALGTGWRGRVAHIDHFGNLGTNILVRHLQGMKSVQVRIKEVTLPGLVKTFGEAPPGSLVALIDSSGELAISVVNGSAQQVLQVQEGETVEVFEA